MTNLEAIFLAKLLPSRISAPPSVTAAKFTLADGSPTFDPQRKALFLKSDTLGDRLSYKWRTRVKCFAIVVCSDSGS
jgi:hypothetical protein